MRITTLAAAAALAISPVVAVAQTVAEDAPASVPADNEDDTPWGLLGLLGLVGLAGLKRRDHDARVAPGRA